MLKKKSEEYKKGLENQCGIPKSVQNLSTFFFFNTSGHSASGAER